MLSAFSSLFSFFNTGRTIAGGIGRTLGCDKYSLQMYNTQESSSLRAYVPVTRQMTSPTSSATKSDFPFGPIATPTGRP